MFKVFPATLIHGNKVPLITGWKHLATNDPEQIRIWQETFRDRITFWGVPTGAINGIVALDVDVKTDKQGRYRNGWDTLKNLNLQLPQTMRQNTPTGGTHFIFKSRPNIKYKNTVDGKGGLDTRGDGGWIAWYGALDESPIADHPEWFLTDFNGSKVETETPKLSNVTLAPEIASQIISEVLDNVRNAPPGESNNVLNIEAYRMGQLVASGNITREFAEAELFKAAKERGKPDYEAKATIKSGIEGGLKHPLTVSFPPNAHIPQFEIPQIPQAPERWTPPYFKRADLTNYSKLKKPQLFEDWSTEDIHLTTADGGTGKTTLKLYEAVCLAIGDRFLGFNCKQTGKTLFITGEDTEAKLGAMIGAILKQMGHLQQNEVSNAILEKVLSSIVVKKDADLCLITKDRQGFLHINPEAMTKVMQAVEDIKPKMIVFDPIASFWGSESMLNDMNKAVAKFMSQLTERSNACVEMINHMGKSSSANKDLTQFAGRGGTGLPSHSRVVRVLRGIDDKEYTELTGRTLEEGESAMVCNVNKFSDGSPLLNKQFVILRKGFLFNRITLTPQKEKELEKETDDKERIIGFIKDCRRAGKWPTRKVITSYFFSGTEPISKARTERALSMLQFEGYMGEKIAEIDNPDQSVKDKALILTDLDGREMTF